MVFSTMLNSGRPQWLTKFLTAQRKKLLMAVAGVGLGLGAMHFTFVRPMVNEIHSLKCEVSTLKSDVQSLTGTQAGVGKTNDLLHGLALQEQSFDAARGSFDRIRSFREQVEQEARRTSEAVASLREIQQLQSELTAVAPATAQANDSIADIAKLQARVTEVGQSAVAQQSEIDKADSVLTSLAELKGRVLEQQGQLDVAQEQLKAYQQLRQELIAAADDLELAITSAEGMRELTGSIANEGQQVAKARETVTGLLTLHDTLADAEGLRLPEARRNLIDLFNMRAELNENTAEVAAAAENLELLIEFQSELTTRLADIKGLRRDLVELSMLKETVDRVSEAVRPLAELTDFKRLNEDDMRAYARRILERRTAQSNDRVEFMTQPVSGTSPAVTTPTVTFPAVTVPEGLVTPKKPAIELPVPDPFQSFPE
ncbi:MAG: hypothetical protein R3C01_00960 [Planctomycetaceae bacterium]